jgi:hypothetical protein
MENIFLCHRSTTSGAEYAVAEHFPARGANEIWDRGWNAVEVLKSFTQEQRQALRVWTEDITAQVKEFLAEKFPGQDLNRVAGSSIHRFSRVVSQRPVQSHAPNHSRGVRF